MSYYNGTDNLGDIQPVQSKNSKFLLGISDEIWFFDIKRKMARIGADNLFGQGIVIQSDNEAIENYLKEFIKINKLDGLLIQACEQANYSGRIVFTLEKDNTDNIKLSFVDNLLLQRVDNIEITPMSAKIMRRRTIGFFTFYITEYWTINKVERSITIKDNNDFEIGVSDLPEGTKLPDEWNLPKVERHNLGFVPIIDFWNRENRNGIQNGGIGFPFNKVADDYEVQHIPLQINHILRQHFKEAVFGKSRVFGQVDSNNIPDGAELVDFLYDTDMTPNQSKPVETMPATYDGDKWIEPVERLINLYALGCGYSELIPKNAQMTEAESLYSKDATQRTLKSKRRRWSLALTDLFQKLLVYAGLETDPNAEPQFSIEIKENVVYNQTQLVSFLIEAIQGGLMTRKEAIMKQRDLDNPENAELILKEIDKDQDEQDERQMKLLDAESGNDMGKAGQDKDPALQSGGK